MAHEISNSDWKLLRALEPVALERFCQRALVELTRVARDESREGYPRFLEVGKIVHKKEKHLARTFDDLRRSNGLMKLALMRAQGVVTDEELGRFSEATRRIVASLTSE